MAGIDEAMARHAQETDKVDLLTLKKLKGRVNVLEQQIVTDKAKQLTVSQSPALPPCIALNLCCCCMANGCDSYGACPWVLRVALSDRIAHLRSRQQDTHKTCKACSEPKTGQFCWLLRDDVCICNAAMLIAISIE